MARSINRLSSRTVTTVSKAGLYADGGGLYLQVTAGRSKISEESYETRSWVFRFRRNGKLRDMGLGSLNTLSLADARIEAEQCRKLLLKGFDPIEHRKGERSRAQIESAKAMTFKECAEGYIKAHSAGWRNAKHAGQWESTLTTYVYPVFGRLPVQAVDTGLVTKVLEPIWATKTETAGRVRGRIESILDWAAARKYRDDDNPARWKGHLDKLLPARSKVRTVKHHAALPYDEMGAFMAALRSQAGVSARGLELQILTAARTGEVIGARWSEFDLDKGLWTIPADRTKTAKEHRIPLSAAAKDLLKGLKEGAAPDGFVLPGGRTGRPLSNTAFLMLLRRMKRDDLTAHGFRSTFRDWAAERTAYPSEVAEMALGHAVADKVEAAYRRGDLFEKRRRMMDDWAEFCAIVAESGADNVIALRPVAV